MKAAIFNFHTWIEECEPESLRTGMNRLLDMAGFERLNYIAHAFEPQGFTAVWLLSESHLAIHTFPEAGKTYVELSSCNEAKNRRFEQAIEVTFKRTKARTST